MEQHLFDRRTVVAASVAGAVALGVAPALVQLASAQESAAGDSAATDKKGAAADSAAQENTIVSVSVEEGPDTRTITDSHGNEVIIPGDVTRVAPIIGAFAQVTEMVTQGGGNIVAAATQQISDDFKKVFPDYEQSNPNNYSAQSVEDLIAADCQVAFGPSSVFSDEQKTQLQAANIAYVALDNIRSVDGMCESIQTIGDILGDDASKVAEQFVNYYRQGIQTSTDATANLADDEKPTVMQVSYNGGQYGTTNGGDISNEYFVAAGSTNVAADYSGDSNGRQLTVSTEQIVDWDPQYIFCMSSEGTDAVKADPALATVQAVVDDHVYTVPTGVYLWSVRSGEGALMTPWLDTILHPDLFPDIDMVAEVQDFYGTYYNYELPEEDAQAIVNGETHM